MRQLDFLVFFATRNVSYIAGHKICVTHSIRYPLIGKNGVLFSVSELVSAGERVLFSVSELVSASERVLFSVSELVSAGERVLFSVSELVSASERVLSLCCSWSYLCCASTQ